MEKAPENTSENQVSANNTQDSLNSDVTVNTTQQELTCADNSNYPYPSTSSNAASQYKDLEDYVTQTFSPISDCGDVQLPSTTAPTAQKRKREEERESCRCSKKLDSVLEKLEVIEQRNTKLEKLIVEEFPTAVFNAMGEILGRHMQ